MTTKPQTGSEVEIEEDGDYTVTFTMRLPQQPAPKPEAK
jgi:hypothetical protein